MNHAVFTGNLTKDPETRIVTNGKPRCTFTLAVQRSFSSAQGERSADFILVTAFEKRAELAQKYLAKGRKVLVECHVRTGSYKNSDGKTVFTTDFVVDRIEFLSSERQHSGEPAAEAEQSEDARTSDDGFTPVDDDLPF